MYTPYLMFAYAAALLMVLLGFRVVRRTAPGLRGLRSLRRFILCDMSAILLMALHPQLIALFSVMVANYLLFVGAIALYQAAAEIVEVQPRLVPWMVALCAASLPPFLWFTYVRLIPVARLGIHCGVVAAIFAMTSDLLFRQRRPGLRDAARAGGWLMAAAATANGVWAAYGIVFNPHINIMNPGAANEAFSYCSMILGLGNLASLIWLSLCVHGQELRSVAETDALTGLMNRGAFEEMLRRELGRNAVESRSLGLVLIDVDYFKQVNDAHGHLVGDDVLRRIGTTLRLGTRPSDALARFGGEEFVLLLRDTGAAQAEEVAERLRTDVAALTDLPGRVTLTASFGVAVSQPGDSSTEFLLRADEALYRSKREGRNLVSVAGSGAREAAGLRIVRN
ncbi:MAG: GGDEF domain-containing protein [Acidobacteriaceae bacterium]